MKMILTYQNPGEEAFSDGHGIVLVFYKRDLVLTKL
jgi:hypothetical protein